MIGAPNPVEETSYAYRCTRHGCYARHDHYCPHCLRDTALLMRLAELSQSPGEARKAAHFALKILGYTPVYLTIDEARKVLNRYEVDAKKARQR